MMLLKTVIGYERRPQTLVVMAVTVALLSTTIAFADSSSPVGLWGAVSDRTGEVTSIVRITLENGELVGTVEKLIREPGLDPNPPCSKCPGEKKGQRYQGLIILWGHQKDDDEWSGGFILDPLEGKTYRSVVRVYDDNRKLDVRGYIGISLFGRSQVWIRKE